MSDITITKTPDAIQTATPYDARFVADAKMIGGRWDPDRKMWGFDLRDEGRVLGLLEKHFAWTPDSASEPTATVHITLTSHNAWAGELTLFGHRIATRTGRDEQVKLGDGLVVVEGSFGARGGSVKHPAILSADREVILEWRDVPRSVVDKLDADKWHLEIIDHAEPTREALEAEKARLRARIAEIDAILAR